MVGFLYSLDKFEALVIPTTCLRLGAARQAGRNPCLDYTERPCLYLGTDISPVFDMIGRAL